MSANLVIFLAIVALTVVFFYLRHRQAQNPGATKAAKAAKAAAEARAARPPRPAEPPEAVFAKLRKRAFETTPESLRMAGSLQEDEPYAVVMEIGMTSVVTLACYADGDASLVYQTGGGMVGGIGHESVRKAAKDFIALSHKAVPLMTPATVEPLPAVPETGWVQFFALTPKGALSVEMAREDLEEHAELKALYQSGQEVVTHMRKIQEQRRA